MATLESSIKLQDGVSKVLRSMTNAINIVIQSFNTMQSASSNCVDTGALQGAKREIDNATLALNQMESAGLNQVVDYPSAYNTIETENENRNEQAYYANYVPFGFRCQFLEGSENIQSASASYYFLGQHYWKTNDQCYGNIYYDESGSAIPSYKIWESPEIAQTYCRPYHCHKYSESATKIFPFHIRTHTGGKLSKKCL